MARTIEVPVWIDDTYLLIRVEGVANDHVASAGASVKKEVQRAIDHATTIAYERGRKRGMADAYNFRPLSERYPRVIKVNNHTHWWKRNG